MLCTRGMPVFEYAHTLNVTFQLVDGLSFGPTECIACELCVKECGWGWEVPMPNKRLDWVKSFLFAAVCDVSARWKQIWELLSISLPGYPTQRCRWLIARLMRISLLTNHDHTKHTYRNATRCGQTGSSANNHLAISIVCSCVRTRVIKTRTTHMRGHEHSRDEPKHPFRWGQHDGFVG